MNIRQMRTALSGAFPSQTWRLKVAKMSEDQVVAVYLRLKATNKI